MFVMRKKAMDTTEVGLEIVKKSYVTRVPSVQGRNGGVVRGGLATVEGFQTMAVLLEIQPT